MTDAVAFDDVRRWLALFAQGLGDQAVLVEPVDDAHATVGRDRAVLDDPTTIRVPTTVATGGGHRIAALRQLGVRSFGTVDADTSDLSPRGHRAFLALEDLRIDAAIARSYPGARTDLARVVALDGHDEIDELVAPFAHQMQRDDATALDSLRIARELGDLDLDDAVTPMSAAELAELLGESVPDAPASASTHAADVPDGEAMPADQMIDGATLAVLGEIDVDVEATHAGGGAGSVVPDLVGDALAASDEAPRDADVAAAAIAGRRARARAPSLDGTTFVYDEWSYVDDAYLRAWCHLTEHRLQGDDFAFIGDVRRRYAVLASQVKRRFAFARTEGWHRVHRTTDGDELELDAVIEAIVDRRAGQPMHDRLHVRRDRAAREVTTAFLVDLSASTSSPIVPPTIERERPPETEIIDYRYGAFDDLPEGPTEPPRRVIDIAKEALALMCDALGVLGDRHAVYGFSGEGRDNVEFQVAKDFDDAVSLRTWAALAAMAPRRYTRMGPAIRHASAKLRAESVRTKILIVVSDGYPQDVDYGPDRFDKEYGVQDTACALREAESAGITTFCMTIDPAGHDYLRRMSSESHYLVIDDVTALPGELVKVYNALTSFAPGLRRAR